MQIVHFLILIGVLIFVHEFGHFIWAKIFKIRVERFALGMGPVIKPLSFRRGETEYAICAFPIGGYVKMFGMQPEELYDEQGQMVPEHVANRAFVRKPIWQRAIVVLAGPAMNLVFPIVVYFAFALSMSAVPPSMVGQVLPGSAASAATPSDPAAGVGLQAGDLIVAIDGEDVRYWHDITDHVRGATGRELTFSIKRGDRTHEYALTPRPYMETDRLGLMQESYGVIGVTLESQGNAIGIRDPKSPAARADLRTFDRIVAIDGRPIKRFVEVQEAVRRSNGASLHLVVARPQMTAVLGGSLAIAAPIKLDVKPEQHGGEWTIGAFPADLFLSYVEPGSPADKAGLRVGDQILAVGDKAYNKSKLLKLDIQQKFWQKMSADPDAEPASIAIPFTIKVERGLETLELSYEPRVRQFTGAFKEPVPEIWFGFQTVEHYSEPDDVPLPLGDRFAMAATEGFSRTWRYSRMMVTGIVRLLEGRVSSDTVGGPIMIFDIAARAGKAGWEPFLRMMAIISINLGLVNLLPIPVLDGGYLMLLSIEAVKRKELNARTRQIAYYIGLGMIVMLMLLAFKNDIERYWEDFAQWFNA